MSIISDGSILGTWVSAGVLTANEVWQSKGDDPVSIATGATAPTDDDDGVTLTKFDSIRLSSGLTVWHLRYQSGGEDAKISRTVV